MRKILILGSCFIVALLTFRPTFGTSWAQEGKSQPAPRWQWRTPSYKGIVLGKSTKDDVRRRFGKPYWIGHPEDEVDAEVRSLIKYNYKNVGGFEGEMWVVIDTREGRVREIILYPTEGREPTLDDVIKNLGSEYIELDGIGPCPTRAELSKYTPPKERQYPIWLAFPSQGAYLTVETGNKVREIVYLDKCP